MTGYTKVVFNDISNLYKLFVSGKIDNPFAQYLHTTDLPASKEAINNALKELDKLGIIDMNVLGGFSITEYGKNQILSR